MTEATVPLDGPLGPNKVDMFEAGNGGKALLGFMVEAEPVMPGVITVGAVPKLVSVLDFDSDREDWL